MYLFFFIGVTLVGSIIFVVMSFLCLEVLKSCFYFCLSVLFLAPLLYLGVVELGVYFIMLIFFSGVLGLMIYFCSLNMKKNSFNVFLFFFVVSMFCGIYWGFYLINEVNLLDEIKLVYDDMNMIIMLWLVFSLLCLLSFLSYNFIMKGCLRGI